MPPPPKSSISPLKLYDARIPKNENWWLGMYYDSHGFLPQPRWPFFAMLCKTLEERGTVFRAWGNAPSH